MSSSADDFFYSDYTQNEYVVPFQGYRRYVAYTYGIFNLAGFLVNGWVLYVVGPLLVAPQVKVPKSILFYILTLCVSDLMTMIGMLFLISEIAWGTWKLSTFACTTYLLFDSMNKFVAPIIVVLISRTCYATVCLSKSRQDRAASLKNAIPQVLASMVVVMILLWPVFAYTNITRLYIKPNETIREVWVLQKCGFFPPPKVELGFNIIACTLSYAIPLFGIIYWYMSVPFFLKKRAETTLIRNNNNSANGATADVALRKVITTVLVLTVVYVLCWTPYWISLFVHRIITSVKMHVSLIVIMYMVHLLPYISCSAYPLIFTVMNRAIQRAHAQMMDHQRRRIKSLTEDVTRHIREAFSFRILDRDNSLFPRSSISVATCHTQRLGLGSLQANSTTLHPPGLHLSPSTASESNISSISLIESTPANSQDLEPRSSVDEADTSL
ncbi:G-PROTEIN-RECEP-F1-2 domain-containing protein [Aphelenchoides besseyi]|nr:G-PROTEIN-RECEP-F1-2 domain-containing protein [Aphelenchoides besseyi]